MANRVKYFSYVLPYRLWYTGEHYTRLNIEVAKQAMNVLSQKEFLLWLYYSLLPVANYYSFTFKQIHNITGLSRPKVKLAIQHFFELGYLTCTNFGNIHSFHSIPVAQPEIEPPKKYCSMVYIEDNIAKELPGASYRVFNQDLIYEARDALSFNGFKLWLDLCFRYPLGHYKFSYAQELNINYNSGVTELFTKGYLCRGEGDYDPYIFVRRGNTKKEEFIDV